MSPSPSPSPAPVTVRARRLSPGGVRLRLSRQNRAGCGQCPAALRSSCGPFAGGRGTKGKSGRSCHYSLYHLSGSIISTHPCRPPPPPPAGTSWGSPARTHLQARRGAAQHAVGPALGRGRRKAGAGTGSCLPAAPPAGGAPRRPPSPAPAAGGARWGRDQPRGVGRVDKGASVRAGVSAYVSPACVYRYIFGRLRCHVSS